MKTIKIDVTPGYSLERIYKQAISIAFKNECLVEFKFNGVLLIMDKNSSFIQVHNYYDKRLSINTGFYSVEQIKTGETLINFNRSTPEVGSKIIYLLGDCQNGLDFGKLVYGSFSPEMGDFEKDEKGCYKYVSYWKSI